MFIKENKLCSRISLTSTSVTSFMVQKNYLAIIIPEYKTLIEISYHRCIWIIEQKMTFTHK